MSSGKGQAREAAAQPPPSSMGVQGGEERIIKSNQQQVSCGCVADNHRRKTVRRMVGRCRSQPRDSLRNEWELNVHVLLFVAPSRYVRGVLIIKVVHMVNTGALFLAPIWYLQRPLS